MSLCRGSWISSRRTILHRDGFVLGALFHCWIYALLTARLESCPEVTAVDAISYLPLSGEAQADSARNPRDVGMSGSDAPAIRVLVRCA